MKTSCPRCHRVAVASDDHAGCTVRCSCGARFQLPPPLPLPIDRDEKVALFTLLGIGLIPLVGSFAVPAIWSVNRDRSPLVDDIGAEAANWQIFAGITSVILAVLCFPIGIGLASIVWCGTLNYTFWSFLAVVRDDPDAIHFPQPYRFINPGSASH